MLNLKLSNELEYKMHSFLNEKKEVLESIRIFEGFKDNCLSGGDCSEI